MFVTMISKLLSCCFTGDIGIFALINVTKSGVNLVTVNGVRNF